jgi:hypothetical protein
MSKKALFPTSDVPCWPWLNRDPDKPKGCRFGSKCRFFHRKTEICKKWEANNCPHTANTCRYLHSFSAVSYEPGPFCVMIFDKGEQDKKRQETAEPSASRKAKESSHPMTTSPPMTIAMIQEQLDKVNADINTCEEQRTMMTQLTEQSKLIFEEAVPLANDIQALQGLLVQKQQHLDTLDSKYQIIRQDFESFKTNYDDSKYQCLLRIKSSLTDNIMSQQKKDDCHRLANRLGVSFQHIEVMMTYMSEAEVLKHFKIESGSTGSTLISDSDAKDTKMSIDKSVDKSNTSDDELCAVCLKNTRTYALYCGHYAYCETCVMNLNECTICREPVIGRQRVYM